MDRNQLDNAFRLVNESSVVVFGQSSPDLERLIIETQDHIKMVVSITNNADIQSSEYENLFQDSFKLDTGFIAENIDPSKVNMTTSKIISCVDWIVDEHMDEMNLDSITSAQEQNVIQSETRLIFNQPELIFGSQPLAIKLIQSYLEILPKSLIVCNSNFAESFIQTHNALASKKREANPYQLHRAPLLMNIGQQTCLFTGGIIFD